MVSRTVVIGAAPAGLTAAYELSKNGHCVTVLESAEKVGGFARTESYRGHRFDLGNYGFSSHGFSWQIQVVQQLWHEILGDCFVQVPPRSRICYRYRLFDYPLSITNALKHTGPIDSTLIATSYLATQAKAQLYPEQQLETLEDWLKNRFGSHLHRIFFEPYVKKIWGLPSAAIHSDLAVSIAKKRSLFNLVADSLLAKNQAAAPDIFDYPALGAGMMWQKCRWLIEDTGSAVETNARVVKIAHTGKRIRQILIQRGQGENAQLSEAAVDQCISSLPIVDLIERLDPPAPIAVQKAAEQLKYRDLIVVSLVINAKSVFEDSSLYIQNPEFKVSRIQDFKNWSAAMAEDPHKTCLSLEYFCAAGDDLSKMGDDDLVRLAGKELAGLGLVTDASLLEGGVVVRQQQVYPVYDNAYYRYLGLVQDYLEGFENLQTAGAQGLYRQPDMALETLTGMLAARNVLGERHNLWEVTEHTELRRFAKDTADVGQRLRNR
ncbi:MAG: FAD-dependent oxidoreductase [Phormidesmis sp.]